MTKKVFHHSASAQTSPVPWLRRWVAGVVWVYQTFLSPWIPARCRFYPTCSEYARESLLRYGVLKGGLIGLRRIFRCHPWNPGGHDPVK